VFFPPNLGAPEQIRLANLESWTANSNDGVKYFSGTATYIKMIQVPKDWLKSDARIMFDLGSVRDIAQVSINGRPAAIIWKPPFRIDVSGLLKPGRNRLEIKVTNQWTNRLIGDSKLDPEKRVLASSSSGIGRFGPPPVLAEAGLLGPITVVSIGERHAGAR
jgi:hypothetical protein